MTYENCALGDLAASFVDGPFGSDLQASEYIDAGVPVARIQNVRPNRFNGVNQKFISKKKADELARHDYFAGDVLITKLGEPCGVACIVPEGAKEGRIVADVTRFRGNQDIVNHRFVSYYLNSPAGQVEVQRHAKGTTRQRINLSALKEVTIPLPPLGKQQQIAAILDKADTLRRKRKRALESLNNLTQSIFLEMFGDPVRNERSFPWKTLREIGQLDRGVSKHRPRNDPKLHGGANPLIQTGDVANSGGYITSYSSTYSDLGLQQSKKWPVGTLCITIAANIAQTGILTFPACFPDSVVGFTHSNSAVVQYVRIWLSFLRSTLERIAPTVAQKNINLEILRNLPIAMPGIAMIEKFGTCVDHQRKVELALRNSELSINNLFSSLQHRAFSGQL